MNIENVKILFVSFVGSIWRMQEFVGDERTFQCRHRSLLECNRWVRKFQSIRSHFVAFFLMDRHFFSASADKTLATWDAETGRRLKKYSQHSAIVNTISSSYGKSTQLIVSGSDDSFVKVITQMFFFFGCILVIIELISADRFGISVKKNVWRNFETDFRFCRWDFRKTTRRCLQAVWITQWCCGIWGWTKLCSNCKATKILWQDCDWVRMDLICWQIRWIIRYEFGMCDHFVLLIDV